MNFYSGIPENWPTCKLGLCLCFNWSPVRNSIVDTFFNLPCLPSLSLASSWFNLNRPPLLRKLRDNSKYFTTQLSWKQRRREIYKDYREDRGLCCTIEVFRCFFFIFVKTWIFIGPLYQQWCLFCSVVSCMNFFVTNIFVVPRQSTIYTFFWKFIVN